MKERKNNHINYLFMGNYYITFLYIFSEGPMYASKYVIVKAVNKRHARKVLFKYLPKRFKRGICRIYITDYRYLPWDKVDNFDGPNHFWGEQDNLN